MISRTLRIAAGLAAALLTAGAANAQAETSASTTSSAQSTTGGSAAPFAGQKAASTEILDRATAREDMSQVATSTQTSTVTGNSVNGTSTTGDLSFSDTAFQNASGLTVINANSGNNVSMNASLNVNIVMVPAGPQQ